MQASSLNWVSGGAERNAQPHQDARARSATLNTGPCFLIFEGPILAAGSFHGFRAEPTLSYQYLPLNLTSASLPSVASPLPIAPAMPNSDHSPVAKTAKVSLQRSSHNRHLHKVGNRMALPSVASHSQLSEQISSKDTFGVTGLNGQNRLLTSSVQE